MSKKIRSPNSIESYRIYSETFSTCVLAESQLHLIGNFLRSFQVLSSPKFNCILSKKIKDNSHLCLSRKSVASYRKYSTRFLKCVQAKIHLNLEKISEAIPKVSSAEIKLHVGKNIPRYVQTVS